MRPSNPETLKTLLQEGVDDATDRQIQNDADRVFAGRMATRLAWALHRIQELEALSAGDSWRGEMDRQGGAFTQEEIDRSRRGGEGW